MLHAEPKLALTRLGVQIGLQDCLQLLRRSIHPRIQCKLRIKDRSKFGTLRPHGLLTIVRDAQPIAAPRSRHPHLEVGYTETALVTSLTKTLDERLSHSSDGKLL